ncbi:carbohydrate ABC transporter permease [Nesterenkonia sphaerica]|uniref:carbohydrate ABC transporter permease n=1 Tax=Nesterenkonia sphaerica TaxID=1804988 RepID=UPI00140D144E|nr:carbohydrate ABC transporter permease [Nesterenkonia sphaerica]
MAIYLAAIVTVVLMGFPLYGVVLTSLQPESVIRSPELSLIPTTLDFSHYASLFSDGHPVPLVSAIGNSVVVAMFSAFLGVALAVPASYALYRTSAPGRRLMMGALAAIYVFPTLLFIIPLYIMWVNLGVFDTRTGLIIPYTAFVLPVMIFILGTFVRSVPMEVEEAARIDGATTRMILTRIYLPLMKPGIFAVLILGFILSWVEFTTPLLFTSQLDIMTVSLALFRSSFDIQIGQLAAAAVVTAIPVVVVTVVFQRRIVGVLTGADR